MPNSSCCAVCGGSEGGGLGGGGEGGGEGFGEMGGGGGNEGLTKFLQRNRTTLMFVVVGPVCAPL